MYTFVSENVVVLSLIVSEVWDESFVLVYVQIVNENVVVLSLIVS